MIRLIRLCTTAAAVFLARVAVSADSPAASGAPCPRSPVIQSIRFAPKDEIIPKGHGDNTPVTWGDDDWIYTAFNDGYGFAPRPPKELSAGFARIVGNPPDFRGENIPSPTGEQYGSGAKGPKTSGILMADGVLYLWFRNVYKNSRIAWSRDHARTWEYGFTFTTSFGCPTFLNFGKNYAGARDNYVYVYSQDGPTAYDIYDGVVLARVLKNRITEREAYEFYSGKDGAGRPEWSTDINQRAHVFVFPKHCQRLDAVYNFGIRRYLMAVGYNHKGGWGIYDAPEPWGPWTTVFHTEQWDCGNTFSYRLPSKWITSDGREMYLVFSALGDGGKYYAFSVRKMTLGMK
jgi:hypothetical protein